jgi:5-methylcytosine-specific restriction protein A
VQATPADSGDPFYKTQRWRKFRRMVLRTHPLCADPFKHHREDGQTVLATEVHHLKSRVRWPELAYSFENAQALCKSCHTRITVRERA